MRGVLETMGRPGAERVRGSGLAFWTIWGNLAHFLGRLEWGDRGVAVWNGGPRRGG